jgi:hypothetical protein
VCHDAGRLFSSRRYPDEVAPPGPALIGMVETEVECDGKCIRERGYDLPSARLGALIRRTA